MEPESIATFSPEEAGEWTKVEFSERQRMPYSFSASETEAAPPQKTESTPGSFPEEILSESAAYTSGASHSHSQAQENSASQGSAKEPPPKHPPDASRTRTAKPRQCRICLDIVHPTVETPSMPSIPGIAPQQPRFVYQDEELGRLISPCKCKGSSRYVHEACLREWRMASPSQNRNYWHCPTCGYTYRLERLTWARYVQSTPSQLGLTLVVFVIAMFIMGFIADPIINLYLDPWSLVGWGWSGASPLDPIEHVFDVDDDESAGWFEHFFKGIAGLGVLGFVKLIIASPIQFFRFRVGGGTANGRTTGRDRIESLNWIIILAGVGTTLYGIYTAVRALSRRALMRTAERVLDVGDNHDDDDDEDEDENGSSGRARQ